MRVRLFPVAVIAVAVYCALYAKAPAIPPRWIPIAALVRPLAVLVMLALLMSPEILRSEGVNVTPRGFFTAWAQRVRNRWHIRLAGGLAFAIVVASLAVFAEVIGLRKRFVDPPLSFGEAISLVPRFLVEVVVVAVFAPWPWNLSRLPHRRY